VKRRLDISSGAKREDIVGYSRAVRVDNIIEVAGTAAAEGDEIIGNTPCQQSKFILSIDRKSAARSRRIAE